jgi:hypothetical protein
MSMHPYFTERLVADHQRALIDRAREHRLAETATDSPSAPRRRAVHRRLLARFSRRFEPAAPIPASLRPSTDSPCVQ